MSAQTTHRFTDYDVAARAMVTANDDLDRHVEGSPAWCAAAKSALAAYDATLVEAMRLLGLVEPGSKPAEKQAPYDPALLTRYRQQAFDTLRAAYARGEISVNVVRSVFGTPETMGGTE